MDEELIQNLLVILTAGFLVGLICRRLGISILIGFLTVGTFIGPDTLGLVRDESHSVQHLAEAGVFLLLFTIGLEFSLHELAKLSRWMLIGGSVQMLLAGVPSALFLRMAGLSWPAAILLGLGVAFSSTVLVFKALAEWGQTDTPHGRRAIGLLLFQDVALVPLLLIIPLLTKASQADNTSAIGFMVLKSLAVVLAVAAIRWIVRQTMVPLLARLRSPEIVVLFVLALLGGVTYGTAMLGLPPALGAFAAGLIFSDNRLSAQIDALLLPFRETFSAVFFISLGLLVQPAGLWNSLHWIGPVLLAVIVLKTAAAAIALKLTGLNWRSALGMGVGLSQLGEFALVLGLQARSSGLIDAATYQGLLTVTLGTLILTPVFLRIGLRYTDPYLQQAEEDAKSVEGVSLERHEAIVIGIGPVGRQVSSRLELQGADVCLVDLSPVNLYSFAQQGFRTAAGDASDAAVLKRAGIDRAELVVVSVPDDGAALRVVHTIRDLNKQCRVLVRCRYLANLRALMSAGASAVVSEEGQAAEAILKLLPREEKV